mmetsp:Transcript_6087/g.11903  ORF Transcript_6087/g.11903 Transcript_6087/m.11903 type:complete len:131 (+) Transcript_6087:579-971(+)
MEFSALCFHVDRVLGRRIKVGRVAEERAKPRTRMESMEVEGRKCVDGGVVRVLFFAKSRELAGVAECEVCLDRVGISVGELVWGILGERFPKLKVLTGSCSVAVNFEVVEPNFKLFGGEEVALIPPISGG